MIESIEIKNFRCFKDTKIAKFGLVNLFGGLNNSGKTALLEALFLVKNPYTQTILGLHTVVRNESSKFGKAMPKNYWDNFFHQQNKLNAIQININDNEYDNRKVSLVCDDNITDLIKFSPENESKDFSEYFSSISGEQIQKSALHINLNENDETHSSILVSSKDGIGRAAPSHKTKQTTIAFLTNQKRTSVELAEEYEKARFAGQTEVILKALQIIDRNIEKVDVFFIGEPILYLTRKNENRMPLTLFGDAMYKVADIIVNIVNSPNSIFLIDEIENGIHYTNQAELWEMLFKLAIEFNVQIFSTSHSLEMIKAFANVAQQFPEKAAYFEMARHYKTGNIIGTSIPIDILEYDIENNFRFRGE